MSSIRYIEREMTELELQRMNAGFNEHGLEFGNPIETAERFGFVALRDSDFAGCSSVSTKPATAIGFTSAISSSRSHFDDKGSALNY